LTSKKPTLKIPLHDFFIYSASLVAFLLMILVLQGIGTFESLGASSNNQTSKPTIENDITYDVEFGCDNKYWGIKNYLNNNINNSNADYKFGRNNDCKDNQLESSIPNENGIKNYVEVIAKTKIIDQNSTAWQAAIQGTDPWGYTATRPGGALNSNSRFPLPADLDYKIQVRYLWSNDDVSKPNTENDNLKASLLVDLWFADTQSPRTKDGQYKNAMVIDLAFVNLENKGGKWGQSSYMWDGAQYYRPFVEINKSNQSIYHYNIVLSTDAKRPMQWYEPSPTTYPKKIKDIINDAFSYNDYKLEDGHVVNNNSNNKLIESNYKLVDVEAGVELWNDKGSAGTIVAAFSLCNLTY
jgi:hypothetical protein